MKKIKRIFSLLIVISVVVSSLCVSVYSLETPQIEFLSYPEQAITQFDEGILKRASSGEIFESNSGYAETGIYRSPYWTCTVGEQSVDAYASLTYDYETDVGVLQSFTCVWAKIPENGLQVELKFLQGEIETAVILPESSAVSYTVGGDGVYFTVNDFGTFTCMINGDSLEYAFTLFVREYTDENAEIERYRNEYGADKVLVFDRAFYECESLDIEDKSVVHFRRGSFFSARHIYDINSEEELAALPKRSPFISVDGTDGLIITGYGTFDFTALDRKERDPMSISFSKNCIVEGLTFINPAHWTVTVYGSENLKIRDITITGYRMNSDGINICNSNNVTVSDSFIRNGDDCFSVKTMNNIYPAHDISFDNCIAWSTKARCFGITGEVEADIYNITFSNCAVIYRNATWDNDRISSLAIVVENGKGNISNVIFENIEIHYDAGRAINCIVYGDDVSDCTVSGIVFKNVTYNSVEPSQFASSRELKFFDKIRSFLYRVFAKIFPNSKLTEFLLKEGGGNRVDVKLENINANGKTLEKKNLIAKGNLLLTIK